jgi:uncharacterized membrane protein HdeD (DUF308 family)
MDSTAGSVDWEGNLRQVTGAWWVLVLLGALGIAAGIIVLVWPDISLASLAWVTGIFLIVDAIFEFAGALSRDTEHRGMLALLGVLSLITGLLLVKHPIAGVLAIALLLGFWLIVSGVVRVMEAFSNRDNRGWNFLIAALEVIGGIVIIAVPDIGIGTLAILVGITFILRGIATLMVGLGLRKLRPAASG